MSVTGVRMKTLLPWRQLHDGIFKDLKTSRLETRIQYTSGWRMVKKGTWCAQYSVIPEKRRDIMRKAPPRLKETEEYFMPGSLPVQPQVIMGSGLVDLSCDSSWDGASRCRRMVGLDEHQTWVRGTLQKIMFRSSCSQTL